ncbi:MAG: replicative DNA helicase [Bacteroidales bacterium]|jgi:replicative DNA helicase|nr:replicative DNA helicase [Bacteroidales bacterium]
MAKTNGRQSKGSAPITDTTRVIGVEAGRLPPQAIDLEEAVLGAIMLEKEAIYEVIEFLKPECFYKEAHAKIYQAIIDLSSREEPIDLKTVPHELRRKEALEEVGGAYYIAQLTNRVMSSAHVEFHARIIFQKYIQRELIRVSTGVLERAFDDSTDVEELLNTSEQAIFEISQGSIKKDVQPINLLLKNALANIAEAGKREGTLIGVPSGFTKLDRLTAGWQPTDLVIIAARPSMGKTAFVLSMARNIAVDCGQAVALFSLEMSSLQLATRMIISETELDSDKIRTGKLSSDDWNYLNTKIAALSEAPVYIDDTPALSVFEFRAKCRRLVQQCHIRIAIIDYLQLMTWAGDTRGNREQEVSNISRSLKAIAKELNIPIIALSQLNRGVENRTGMQNKRPQLSDLRESGAIEQDADIVAFIHRPEYYGFIENDKGESLQGIAEIIIAKHRNGALDNIQLRFRHQFAKFVELETDSLSYDLGSTQTLQSKMNEDNLADETSGASFPEAVSTAPVETPF